MKIIIFFFVLFLFYISLLLESHISYKLYAYQGKRYFNIKTSLCHIVYVFKIISVHVIIIFYKALSKRK